MPTTITQPARTAPVDVIVAPGPVESQIDALLGDEAARSDAFHAALSLGLVDDMSLAATYEPVGILPDWSLLEDA